MPGNIVAEYVGKGQDDSSTISAVLKGHTINKFWEYINENIYNSILMNPTYRNMFLTKVYKEKMFLSWLMRPIVSKHGQIERNK